MFLLSLRTFFRHRTKSFSNSTRRRASTRSPSSLTRMPLRNSRTQRKMRPLLRSSVRLTMPSPMRRRNSRMSRMNTCNGRRKRLKLPTARRKKPTMMRRTSLRKSATSRLTRMRLMTARMNSAPRCLLWTSLRPKTPMKRPA